MNPVGRLPVAVGVPLSGADAFEPILPDVSSGAPPYPFGNDGRTTVGGKFLFAAGQKLYVRGVTYGAFRPDAGKREYWDTKAITRDFAMMADAGFNAVRIPHTMPPVDLLDIAAVYGLRVMVGLSAGRFRPLT